MAFQLSRLAFSSCGSSKKIDGAWTLAPQILVPISCLRPTQVAVGTRCVAAKIKRLEGRKRRRIARDLAKRPIPAVFGPEGALYIVDHHHLSLALLRRNVNEAPVHVIGDYSHLSPRRFWATMERLGFVYPFDESGKRVAVAELPTTVGALKADPFRDLAWSVRKAGGFRKSSTPFSEFRWAEFFRLSIPLSIVQKQYDRAVELALQLARSAAAAGLPGYVCR